MQITFHPQSTICYDHHILDTYLRDNLPSNNKVFIYPETYGPADGWSIEENDLRIIEAATTAFPQRIRTRQLVGSDVFTNRTAVEYNESVNPRISMPTISQSNLDNSTLEYVLVDRHDYDDYGAVPLAIGAWDDNRFYVATGLHVWRNQQVHGFEWSTLLDSWIAALNGDTSFAERAEQRLIEQMRTVLQSQGDQAIRDVEEEISDNEMQLQSVRRQIQTYTDNLRDGQARLDLLLSRRESGDDIDAEREIQAINRHAMVDQLSLVNGGLTVKTKPIELEHPVDPDTYGTAVLGEYRLTFDFENNEVKIRNLTNAKGTYDHPHVNNQRFCAGEWQPTVDSMVRDRQIAAATTFIINCLKNVNPDDTWGRTYRHWWDDDDSE